MSCGDLYVFETSYSARTAETFLDVSHIGYIVRRLTTVVMLSCNDLDVI